MATPAKMMAMATVSRHEFTGHEGLDNAGLWMVNMNGRIYVPSGSMFLSPDPHISDPGNTQSYNRYSYVNNNPLSLVDPTGFDLAEIVVTSSRPSDGSFTNDGLGGYSGNAGSEAAHDSNAESQAVNALHQPLGIVVTGHRGFNLQDLMKLDFTASLDDLLRQFSQLPGLEQGSEESPAESLAEYVWNKVRNVLCRKFAGTFSAQGQVDAGVFVDFEAQVSATVTSHGQFIFQAQKGALFGPGYGVVASASVQPGVIWHDSPVGWSPTSSYVANAFYTEGLIGGGGSLQVNGDGGSAAWSGRSFRTGPSWSAGGGGFINAGQLSGTQFATPGFCGSSGGK